MKNVLILVLMCVIVLILSVLGLRMLVKEFKEQLNAMRVLRVTALVVILSPIITYGILDLCRILKKFQLVEAIGSADAWIGFAGSIIGGSITMLALYLTFRHERDVGRQQYIDSIKPYISCRIVNYDEDERTIDVGKCIDDYGFIKCKMKNISNSIANISYFDQYISLEKEKGVYEKQKNLDQFGILIYTVQLDNGFFLAPKDDYKWNVNFNIELDNQGNYRFRDSAFAFQYTILFKITDVLKADAYIFEFSFDVNINIDTKGEPILFLENQSNSILENTKSA